MLKSFLGYCKYELNLSTNTISSYKNDISHFEEFMIKKKYEEVDRVFVEKYIQSLSLNGLEASSLNRKISALRSFFKFLLEEGLITKNPVSNLSSAKKVKDLPHFLTQIELNKLIKIAKEDFSASGIRAYCLLMILIASGMRVSEVVNLKLSSLFWLDSKNFEPKISVIGKGNKERIVPINILAKDALQEYLKVRNTWIMKNNDTFLFPSKKGGNISRVFVGLMLKNLARVANIDDKKVHPHAFRHSVAMSLVQGGMDIRLVQEFLGHKDISTTQIYTQVNIEEVKNLVKNFHPFAKK